MNTLIANQYGRVQGEAGGCGLTLCVTAQTPRRESVELQPRVDSVEQQLHLLAILRAAATAEVSPLIFRIRRTVQTNGKGTVQVEVQARVINDEAQDQETASYAYE